MARLRVIVVGGFLGSGKTTLLAQSAKHLAAQGKRVGIITNDQATQLVDTQYLSALGVPVGEVSGGCFCCRFKDLENAAERLFEQVRPEVLLSEPVGSCTDISATVLQPIKRYWGGWADLAPFTVLADPRRLRQVLDVDAGSSFPESVRYIIRKQFEEADIIVINKADLLLPEEIAELRLRVSLAWPGAAILDMSALKDRGIGDWLKVLAVPAGGGNRILDVDYDTYAQGEAELGWLNATMTLTGCEETDWSTAALDLIRTIQTELARRSAEIGHLKLLLAGSSGQILANATSIAEIPTIHGSLGRREGVLTLVVNARARMEPDQLRSIVERSVASMAVNAIEASILSLRSFSPAYPTPMHRIGHVVQP